MEDLLFVLATLAFFALAAAYVRFCDRIIGADRPTAGEPCAVDRRRQRRQRRRAGARRRPARLPGRRPRVPREVLTGVRPRLVPAWPCSSSCWRSPSPLLGRYLRRRLRRPRPRGRARPPRPATASSGRSSGCSTGSLGVDEHDGSSAGTPTPCSLLAFSALSVLGLYGAAAPPGRAAAEPERHRRRRAVAGLEHRGQLRHQHQLAELRRRVQQRRQPPRPDGRAWPCRTSCRPPSAPPVVVALIRGIARRRKRTLGNFWVDLTRTTVRVLLPLSLVARRRLRRPGRDPEPRRLPPGHHRRGRRAARSPAARSPARSPSSSSAPTAAASSTPTPPTRSRTPTRITNLLSMWAHAGHPVRLPVRLRAHGEGPAPGPRAARR